MIKKIPLKICPLVENTDNFLLKMCCLVSGEDL